jgi:glycosyltransferase involved in cell wall biosynthesis
MSIINKPQSFFVDCHVFDKGFQGTRTYIQGLYLELIKDQNRIFYFASTNVENLKSIFGTQPNVFYLAYKSNNPVLRLLFEIPYLIKRFHIDYAHFQYRVAPLKFCKYIVTTHDVLFEDFPEYFPKINRLQSFWTYKYSAKKADIVFTVSQYSRQKIQQHLLIKNPIVMHNGVNEVFFEQYNKEQVQNEVFEKFQIENYLIYVSRWEPRKNHHLVLQQFVELKLYTNHHLVFVGDDTFKNCVYEDYYANLTDVIKNKITTFKRVDFPTMLLLLRGAKLSVYPSIAEGFGIPPLESIAAKIPTLVSNTTAMSDFDFLEEYAFNPNNSEEFKSKLVKVLTEDYHDMESKIQSIQQRYNWQLASTIFNEALIDS